VDRFTQGEHLKTLVMLYSLGVVVCFRPPEQTHARLEEGLVAQPKRVLYLEVSNA